MSTFEIATMPPEQLRVDMGQWLRERNLGRGVHFYSAHEWLVERGEPLGIGALLHLVIEESPLFALLNQYEEDLLADVTATLEDLDAFLFERGYWWELGFSWSLHCYPDGPAACQETVP